MNCTQSLRPISLNLEWCQLPACTPVLLEGLLAPSKLISIRSNSIASKGISNHLPLQCIAAVVYGCWWPAPASRCAMDSASKPFKAFRTNSKWTRMMQSKCQMNKRKNTFVLKWFEDVWRISSSTTVFRDPSLQRSSDRKLLCLAFRGGLSICVCWLSAWHNPSHAQAVAKEEPRSHKMKRIERDWKRFKR